MTETLNREELTPKDKELLENTLRKSVSELTVEDKGIIRARRSYLSALEKDVFEEVLNDEEVEEEEVSEEEVDEKPKKKKKK